MRNHNTADAGVNTSIINSDNLQDYIKLFKVLTKRVIAFSPVYVDITDSVKAGLLLSQLVYHSDRYDGDWFWKTDETIRSETRLSEHEMRDAKKRLLELKVIDVQLKGFPAITHYKVNIQRIIELAVDNGNVSSAETANPVPRKPPTQFRGNRQANLIEDLNKRNIRDTLVSTIGNKASDPVDKILEPPRQANVGITNPSAVASVDSLSDQEKKNIKRRLAAMKRAREIPEPVSLKSIEQLLEEVVYQVDTRDRTRYATKNHAINSACKLIRGGQWGTPKGLVAIREEALESNRRLQKQQEIHQAKSITYLHELKEMRGLLYQSV